MATVHADNLPQPNTLAVRFDQARAQTRSGEFLFTNRPDTAQAPRIFEVTWSDTFGAVADVVRRHYRDHAFAVFTFTVPRSGELVKVTWRSPPNIQWRSAVSASIAGELEEQLAHE
jgi:hypothetical protein